MYVIRNGVCMYCSTGIVTLKNVCICLITLAAGKSEYSKELKPNPGLISVEVFMDGVSPNSPGKALV